MLSPEHSSFQPGGKGSQDFGGKLKQLLSQGYRSTAAIQTNKSASKTFFSRQQQMLKIIIVI